MPTCPSFYSEKTLNNGQIHNRKQSTQTGFLIKFIELTNDDNLNFIKGLPRN